MIAPLTAKCQLLLGSVEMEEGQDFHTPKGTMVSAHGIQGYDTGGWNNIRRRISHTL